MENARSQRRVGLTDRNTEVRCTHQRDGPGSFCGESSEGREFGDALAHGLDDTPPPGMVRRPSPSGNR